VAREIIDFGNQESGDSYLTVCVIILVRSGFDLARDLAFEYSLSVFDNHFTSRLYKYFELLVFYFIYLMRSCYKYNVLHSPVSF